MKAYHGKQKKEDTATDLQTAVIGCKTCNTITMSTLIPSYPRTDGSFHAHFVV